MWHDGNSNLELSSTSPSRRGGHGGGTKICSLSFKKIQKTEYPTTRVLAKGRVEVEGRVAERDGSNAVAGRSRPDIALMEDTRTTQNIADRLFFSMPVISQKPVGVDSLSKNLFSCSSFGREVC